MGTLKVDNLQKEDGTAVITNGVIPVSILTNSNAVSYTHLTLPTKRIV